MELPDPLRLRVQLTKRGRMRYLSHSEFTHTLMLSARRSGLPLQYAGRRHSRMKISLSPPLPIGITSECELVDFSLTSYVSQEEAAEMLRGALPEGIDVIRCRLLGSGAKAVGKLIDTASYAAFPLETNCGKSDWENAVVEFLGREVIDFERVQPRRTRVVNLRSGVHRLAVEGSQHGKPPLLRMVLDDGVRGTVKPREVLRVLAEMAGATPGVWDTIAVNRDDLFVRRGDRLVSPMDLGKRKPAV